MAEIHIHCDYEEVDCAAQMGAGVEAGGAREKVTWHSNIQR